MWCLWVHETSTIHNWNSVRNTIYDCVFCVSVDNKLNVLIWKHDRVVPFEMCFESSAISLKRFEWGFEFSFAEKKISLSANEIIGSCACHGEISFNVCVWILIIPRTECEYWGRFQFSFCSVLYMLSLVYSFQIIVSVARIFTNRINFLSTQKWFAC